MLRTTLSGSASERFRSKLMAASVPLRSCSPKFNGDAASRKGVHNCRANDLVTNRLKVSPLEMPRTREL
eukprot:7625148-Pyramimonas_sp.AAC.1